MNFTAPFGVATGCHPGDKPFVGATLASIRHFLPEVPICLVADGGVDVRDLESQYGLQVVRTEALSNPQMREFCQGSCHAKLVPMWVGPFERYVWMDSDTIAWGDIRPKLDMSLDFQIFWSEVSIKEDATEPPDWLGHFYFDLEKLLEIDPAHEWRGRAYFSAGTYACRHGFLSFTEWMELEDWNKRTAGGVFKFWDQGLLNYAVHSAQQRGTKKIGVTNLQQIIDHHGLMDLDAELAGVGWRFPQNVSNPRIIHFCGRKPYLHHCPEQCRAFTIARLQHHRKTRSQLGAWLAVLMEEGGFVGAKLAKRLRKAFGG